MASLKRLTDRQINSSDRYYMNCSKTCIFEFDCQENCDCEELDQLIDRLGQIEDILGDEYDLDRLRELVEADRAGRVKILSSSTGMTCGACDHFKRIPGTCRGHCSERPYCRNKYGYTDERRGEFTPSQSRIACKMFDRRKGPEMPDISDLSEEAKKLYNDILSGNILKGE